ncbi:MAG TPA: 4-hydroxy-3-methylbut-2-enyl diphosphate reductase [Clostridiales bacterium]|nr:4-hydroxy-3-methylbut-2-enyl diphosphate reductase [Clostridiales bacterium]
MEVKMAKTAGFCFGIERAVNIVYKEIEESKLVYTYGPITHNEEVIKDLTNKGVKVLESLEELKNIEKSTIVIRAHGVAKEVYDTIESKGHSLVDATCPYVRKIHKIVQRETEKGRHIIIVGNNTHPEVEGIKGWCQGNYTVIADEKEALELEFNNDEKLCLVAQTTYNYNKFKDLVEIISKKGYDCIIMNTICSATEERQQEVRELAKKCDAMIIIGGKHSSNTQKLYEISKLECKNTYYIQTLKDLDLERLQSYCNVGITAGASTPNHIIKEVHTACQRRVLNKCWRNQ